MRNINTIKSFSGVIKSVRGVSENGESFIEFKLEHHEPYFRVTMEQYKSIGRLLFVGHATTIKAYRGRRHWKLAGIDDSFSFAISKIGGSTDCRIMKWFKKQIED